MSAVITLLFGFELHPPGGDVFFADGGIDLRLGVHRTERIQAQAGRRFRRRVLAAVPDDLRGHLHGLGGGQRSAVQQVTVGGAGVFGQDPIDRFADFVEVGRLAVRRYVHGCGPGAQPEARRQRDVGARLVSHVDLLVGRERARDFDDRDVVVEAVVGDRVGVAGDLKSKVPGLGSWVLGRARRGDHDDGGGDRLEEALHRLQRSGLDVDVVLDQALFGDVDIVVGGAREVRRRQVFGGAELRADDVVRERKVIGGDREPRQRRAEVVRRHRFGRPDPQDQQRRRHRQPTASRIASSSRAGEGFSRCLCSPPGTRSRMSLPSGVSETSARNEHASRSISASLGTSPLRVHTTTASLGRPARASAVAMRSVEREIK